MKVLFAGNSITRHGPAPEIGWGHDHGMAASGPENDYVHQLAAMLALSGRKPRIMVENIASFERDPSSFHHGSFSEMRNFDADIVIIRIAENVPSDKLNLFGAAYPRLIGHLNRDGHAKVFCVGGFWKNAAADRLIQSAAAACGAVYVSLSALHDEKYQALGQFEHGGVASHPSDDGMRAIAEAIFAALEESGALAKAVVYPNPDGEVISGDYKVTVDGQDTPCLACRVSAMPFNREWPGRQRPVEQSELAAFVYFDMNAPAEVSVTANRDFKEVVIRPLSKGIRYDVNGRAIRFTVNAPGQFSLELDGRHHNLHIFANPVEEFQRTSDTIYFGPGVHEAGMLELRDGQTLFIDGGAVVYGSVKSVRAANISIVGHGILDQSKMERHDPLEWGTDGLVNLIKCENVRIDGVILRDSNWWTITTANCRNLRFNNVKTIGMWRHNTDGFDFVNSQNVHVSNCFLRNFDDVIVMKGLRLSDYEYMNEQNYLVEGCVLWCDWGAAIEFGAETVADEYSNLVFRDCDIIRNTRGGLRFKSGDRARIHNVLFEDIRIEYSKHDRGSIFQTSDDMRYEPEDKLDLPAAICGWMYCGKWTNDMVYGSVTDVIYRDIKITADEGMPMPAISFSGVDARHTFDRITFDGLYFNGKRITERDPAFFHANEHVGEITLE